MSAAPVVDHTQPLGAISLRILGQIKVVVRVLIEVADISAEYIYSRQLRALEQGATSGPMTLPPEACRICTPPKLEAWREMLRIGGSWTTLFGVLRMGSELGSRRNRQVSEHA